MATLVLGAVGSALGAGFGADGKPVSKEDEYNIAAFSVSQSAKLMSSSSAAARKKSARASRSRE
jgi:hypothetical protein